MCELSGQITHGDAKCRAQQMTTPSCRSCRPYQEFVPVLQLPAEHMQPQHKKGQRSRLGSATSPAADLAVKYFDSINSQLDAGGSWITICNLIKQATGAVFDRKTLQRYFAAEMVKRGLPVRELLQGCPKSRQNRLVAR